MASITTNGVVKQVPYCLLQDFNFIGSFTLLIKAPGGGVRDWPKSSQLRNPVFCYAGDTVIFSLPAPVREVYAAFNVASVDPTLGTVAVAAAVSVVPYYRNVSVLVQLDATTWLPTLTPAYS